VSEICNAYLDAGADIVATNTFNSNAISLSDYGITGWAREINMAAAKLTRGCATPSPRADPSKPRFGRGRAWGPPTRRCRCRRTSTIPASAPSASTRLKGISPRTGRRPARWWRRFHPDRDVFDTLNARQRWSRPMRPPNQGRAAAGMVSMTLTDLAGRNLSGQTVEAFWHSVRHASR